MRRCNRLARKRVRQFEVLETRRLLIGEGDLFNVQQNFESNGLLGDISGEIRWGDGTSAPLQVTGNTNVATDGIKVVFDYDLDDNRFFNQPGAKEALQFAADIISSRFQDQLNAVRPNPPGLSGLSYRPFVLHPSQGPSDQATGNQVSLDSKRDIVVNENEIRIFPGGRNLRQRFSNGALQPIAAFAGPGDIDTESVSCVPSQCAAVSREIDEFKARGQTGTTGTNASDFALTFGQISFNTTFDWDFSIDSDPIENGKVDFLAVALHELAHVFGFATSDVWNNQISGGRFTGKQSTATYVGSGNVPLFGNAHWDAPVYELQPTLLTGLVQTGKGRSLSDLDFASLEDLGWQVRSEGDVGVSAGHQYANNGVYDVSVVLSGSEGGEQLFPIETVTIDNVAPTVTAVADFSAPQGINFDIENIGVITDAGADDTFTYEIQWGDGVSATGSAMLDGVSTNNTAMASFDGSHSYDTPGVKTVTLIVTDSDQASSETTFQITVTPPPELTLVVNTSNVDEDAGADAVMLTVRRSGPAFDAPQRIDLQSSDTSELRLPAFVNIPAGERQATVSVDAIDDRLLDGTQEVTLSASGSNVQSDEISINVRDREALSARIASDEVEEGRSVNVRVERSNADDTQAAIELGVSGIVGGQFTIEQPVMIEAGQIAVNILVTTIDDDEFETPASYQLRFTSPGYDATTVDFTIIDDERSIFQNPNNRFDVNTQSGVTANDALVIINAIARRDGNATLDPDSEQPDGVFLDVNGDFQVTAADALQVINELARQSLSESEQIAVAANQASELATLKTDRLHDEAIGLMF